MKQYQYNERHERVTFSAREVLCIRPVLEQLSNEHPTFVSIRSVFQAEHVNISSKQAEVLNRALASEGKPSLPELAARNPFQGIVSVGGTVETAIRRIMAHLECSTYGDWTYSDEFASLPAGFLILEVRADRPVYVAFQHPRDLDTATIALEATGWMM